MSYSYPLDMPSTPAPSRSTIRLRRATAMAMSPFTGEQQVQEYPFALWQAEITLPPMRRPDAAAWQAFFLKLRGRRGTFLMGDPDARVALGTATTASVNGAGQTGNTLVVDGMGAGATLLMGSYVEVPSNRLHMLVEDAVADGMGAATLTLEPALRSSPTDNAALILSNPRGIWRLTADDAGWDADAASIYGFGFSAVEAL